MDDQFSRTRMLIGERGLEILKNVKIIIFGVGGVGSFVAESLARCGVGNIFLVDKDNIDITNLNRQIHATHKTIGLAKVDVMKERILDINPCCNVVTYKQFFIPDSDDLFDEKFDYVIDCVDTVTAKIEIIVRAKKMNVSVISSMGTGNKLDPTKFEVSDIYKTEVCPLAKVMRKELKLRGIRNLKVVYSKENPRVPILEENNKAVDTKKVSPASISFVPSVAGLIISGEVIKDILNIN